MQSKTEYRDQANMYRLDCPRAGRHHCDVTDLVLDGQGVVDYITVPWDKEFLSSEGKRPAGPMFWFRHISGSFHRLHLPHCQILSDGKCDGLYVFKLTSGKTKFIQPETITDKYASIRISGFSYYGLVKDDNNLHSPIHGMVVMFYQPTRDPDLHSSLHILLLPRNAMMNQVQQGWKKTDGMEYIRVPPECELIPDEMYQLSGEPAKLIQPEVARFLNYDNYDNYTASFEVRVTSYTKQVQLSLKHQRRTSLTSALMGWLLGQDVRRVFFGQRYTEVWRRDAMFNAAPLDPAGGRMELRDALLHALKRLTPDNLATFKRHLTQCPDPLFISELQDADCMDIVEQMVQKYMDGAKVKAADILRKMNFNTHADELERS